MKKSYVSPSIKTEMIEIGVFGCYGGGGEGRPRERSDHHNKKHRGGFFGSWL